MIPLQLSRRVAPLLVLLVIILSIIGLRSTLFQETDSPEQVAIEVTATPAITPTPSPFDPQTAYQQNRIKGQLQVALYHLLAQTLTDGWTTENYIQAGNLWRDMGDTDRALPYWEAANQAEPNALLLRQIALIYMARGEWGAAYEHIEALLLLAPNEPWGLYYGGLMLAPYDPTTAYGYLGRVADLDREYAATARSIMDIIVGNVTDPLVSIRVGAAMANAEEFSLAENAFQHASSLYYPFPEAEAFTALMRVQQGKNGNGWMERAIAQAPQNGTVRYLEGLYWRALGQYANSEIALLRAIQYEPNNPVYYAELGNTYRQMGDLNEADVWLNTAVIISDNDPIIRQALDRFYAEEAYLLPQDYLNYLNGGNTNNDDPAIISATGWAMHIMGDSEGGLAQVEIALAAEPSNPRVRFDHARILLALGRIEEARADLEMLADGNSVFAQLSERLLESLDD